MDTYSIDFETTYSKKVSIHELGTYAYLRHPWCEIYMVSVYPCGLPKGRVVQPWALRPEAVDWSSLGGHGSRWVAHNASFDEAVALRLVELGVIPEHCLPEEWACTSDLCSYLGFPRDLKSAVKVAFKEDISKEVRTNMKGRAVADLTKEEWADLLEYAGDDAIWCARLWDSFGHLWPTSAHTIDERRLSRLTRRMEMRRGAHVNVGAIPKLHDDLVERRQELARGIPWVDWTMVGDKWVQGKNGPAAIKARDKWFAEQGHVPPSTSKDDEALRLWMDQQEEEGRPHLVKPLKDLIEWRSVKRISDNMSKLAELAVNGMPGNRAPVSLKYAGAHTLRWTNSSKFNWLNMDRKGDTRNLITPAPGNVLVGADYSQIEPRCLAYLAGAWDFLEMLADTDVYEAHARTSMGYTDPRPLDEVDPDMRKYAKVRILGGGYGAGADRFREMAMTFTGMELTREEAKEVVEDFRATNPHIPELWAKLDRELRNAALRGDKLLELELPSGRIMRYQKPTRRKKRYPAVINPEDGEILRPAFDKWVFTVQIPGEKIYREVITWGGVLTENITQAMARDVFVDGMLRIEDRLEERGIEDPCGIILHVYDEFLLEVPEEHGEWCKAMLEHEMSISPEWAKSLPLAADANILTEYTK